MTLIESSVKLPHSVIVATLLCAIFGYLAMQAIPVQLTPTVDEPQIQVNTVYRGASPQEIEDQITDPIEEGMEAVSGIERIVSTSAEGRSSVTLEFEWGADKDAAMIDVINKLSQVTGLPDDAESSEVISVSSDEQNAVMWIVLDSDMLSPNELFDYAKETIEPQMRRIDGVSDLMVFGGEEKEMQIMLSPESLVAKGVTIQELASAIRRENLNVRGGFIEQGKRRFNLRTVGQFTSPEEVGAVILKRSDAGVVYLRDVATVAPGFKPRLSLVRVDGKQTVVMGVRRKSGANVLSVCKGAQEKVRALNDEYRSKGLDVQMKVVYSEEHYIEDSIALAKENLLFGGLLAAAVLVLFLRSLRSTLVVAISIPVCMVTVFIFLNLFGRSLNIISLAGLAFSSGMIVDNAIVVIENIYRHVAMGKTPIQAAIDATVEVWGAILISTLTTLAVFIPIIFISAEAGQLFKDIAIAISLAISLSLLAAITLIPMLAGRLVPPLKEKKRSGFMIGLAKIGNVLNLSWVGTGIYWAYDHILHVFVGRHWWQVVAKLVVVGGAVGLFFYSLEYLPDREYLPSGNRNLVLVLADPIVGNNLDKSVSGMEPLEQMMLAERGEKGRVERIFVVLGDRFKAMGIIVNPEYLEAEEDWHGGGIVGPFRAEQRMQAFVGETMGKSMAMSGYKFLFPIQMPIFRTPSKEIEIDIVGPSLEQLTQYSGAAQGAIYANQTLGAQRVSSNYADGSPELQVRLDHRRAADNGLRVSEVAELVQSMVAGNVVGEYSDDGRQIDLALYAKDGRIDTVESLRRIPLATPSGKTILLEAVADIEMTTGPTAINHVEKERSITLTVNINPAVPLEKAVAEIEGTIIPNLQAQMPPNYTIRLAGSADKLNSTIDALTASFGLAVLIVYLLMVSLFRSWAYPLIILVTIPLAASGAFAGITIAHAWSGGLIGFDVLAMLGLIILAGIVVNNGILIVHQALNYQREGYGPYEALRESCRTRLRPIAMSVITSVLGMLPLAIGQGAGSELYRGLGAVILGGLIVSTVFTLFVVPALMALIIDVQRLFGFVSAEQLGHRPANVNHGIAADTTPADEEPEPEPVVDTPKAATFPPPAPAASQATKPAAKPEPPAPPPEPPAREIDDGRDASRD